jgi:hypothetical protein
LKLNGTHQLLVYADDLHIIGWEHTYYKEALVFASEETDQAVNA